MSRCERLPMLLTKTDLLPHVESDPKLALENARKMHPEIEQMRLSSQTGDGFPVWKGWFKSLQDKAQREALATVF